MFDLEVDYGACGGGCRDCKLSNVSGRELSNTRFTQEQKEITDRIVRIFGHKIEKRARLSFSQCLSTFTSESDFVDTGDDLPVTELLLYINSHTVDMDNIISGIELFLLRYPSVRRVIFSLFRGSKNLHFQQSALQRIVPDLLRFLNGKKQIKNFNIAFGANDIKNMRSFTPLQRDFSCISELTNTNSVVGVVQEIHAQKIDDVLELPRNPLEKFRRRTIRFSLPQKREFSLGLYRDQNDLRLLNVSDALRIMRNTPLPNFHVSPTHTFLYHHPLLSRIPGIQVTHEHAHELLDFYEKGNPWSELVQGSILRSVLDVD